MLIVSIIVSIIVIVVVVVILVLPRAVVFISFLISVTSIFSIWRIIWSVIIVSSLGLCIIFWSVVDSIVVGIIIVVCIVTAIVVSMIIVVVMKIVVAASTAASSPASTKSTSLISIIVIIIRLVKLSLRFLFLEISSFILSITISISSPWRLLFPFGLLIHLSIASPFRFGLLLISVPVSTSRSFSFTCLAIS